MKIKTSILKEMVNKVSKGAGNNKLIPLTNLIGIEVKDNVLMLTTTDATNFVRVTQDVNSDDFFVTVSVDTFSKLIDKTTSDEIEFTVTENAFEVKGNGKYKIDIQVDEDGSPIKFVDKFNIELPEKKQTIQKDTISLVLNANKAAVATTLEAPCYTGYYFGDDVVTTDSYKICATDRKPFDTACLISPSAMELLGVFTEDVIDVYTFDDNVMMFETPTMQVYTVQLEGIEDFAIKDISKLVDTKMGSMCKFRKNEMINLLDRISLFISPYDNSLVTLTFTEDGILVSSKKSNGTELIKYTETSEFKPFECVVDINLLLTQIKAQNTDICELWYGADTAIKMVTDDITQIIALAENN